MTDSCAATTSSAIASKVCFQQAAKPTATDEMARLAVGQEGGRHLTFRCRAALSECLPFDKRSN